MFGSVYKQSRSMSNNDDLVSLPSAKRRLQQRVCNVPSPEVWPLSHYSPYSNDNSNEAEYKNRLCSPFRYSERFTIEKKTQNNKTGDYSSDIPSPSVLLL